MNDIAAMDFPSTRVSEVVPRAGIGIIRPGFWKCLKGRRRAVGFTLIEVLIVVVILGILSAIALPGLATHSDLSVAAAARIVVADLLYAQSQAIATGQPVFVSFTITSNNPGGGQGSYTLSSPYGSVVTNPVTGQPYAQTLGSGLVTPLADAELSSITLDAPANSVLVFNELGQPLVCPPGGGPVALANTGKIELASGSATLQLSIEPGTGNITVSAGH